MRTKLICEKADPHENHARERRRPVPQRAGRHIGRGLGVSVSDLNGDMLPDIYVSNDFWERDYLYLNQSPQSSVRSPQSGAATTVSTGGLKTAGLRTVFKEELTTRIPLCSVASMGADIADLNNDGNADIFTTDMLAADNYRLKAMTLFDPYHLEDLKYRADYHYQILQNCLQMNDGNANFTETANLSGVAATDWSWGALSFDFDNDGWKDIFVANAIYKEIMYLDFTNFINDKEEVKKVVTEKGWRGRARRGGAMSYFSAGTGAHFPARRRPAMTGLAAGVHPVLKRRPIDSFPR